jgi:hypothetical protein
MTERVKEICTIRSAMYFAYEEQLIVMVGSFFFK